MGIVVPVVCVLTGYTGWVCVSVITELACNCCYDASATAWDSLDSVSRTVVVGNTAEVVKVDVEVSSVDCEEIEWVDTTSVSGVGVEGKGAKCAIKVASKDSEDW